MLLIFVLNNGDLSSKTHGVGMVAKSLQRMNAADALRQAILMSAKSSEEIEVEAGMTPGALDRYCSRRDAHWPSLINIANLCVAMGNDLLIQWLQEQYDAAALKHVQEPFTEDDLLREMVKAAKEFGDVAAAVDLALRDDSISRREALAIRREAMEAAARLYRIINGVAGRV